MKPKYKCWFCEDGGDLSESMPSWYKCGKCGAEYSKLIEGDTEDHEVEEILLWPPESKFSRGGGECR